MDQRLSRSVALDAVRGIAILQILAWHFIYPPLAAKHSVLAIPISATWSGVDLFFVLSGFLIGGILLRNREAETYFTPFYGRRFLRIVPLYAILVALYFITMDPQTPLWVYGFFVQNFYWALQPELNGGSFTQITWSLAVEEQFYLILPLLVRFCPMRTLPRVLIGAIIAAPILRFGFQILGYPIAAYVLMPCRMDALFLGVLLAWSIHTNTSFEKKRLWVAAFALSIIYVGLLWLNQYPYQPVMSVVGHTSFALFYTTVLALVIQTPMRDSYLLRFLGLAGLGAYSLYLFHSATMDLAVHIFGNHISTLCVALVFS